VKGAWRGGSSRLACGEGQHELDGDELGFKLLGLLAGGVVGLNGPAWTCKQIDNRPNQNGPAGKIRPIHHWNQKRRRCTTQDKESKALPSHERRREISHTGEVRRRTERWGGTYRRRGASGEPCLKLMSKENKAVR